ncbi:MAG: FAD/NAD(P)-binding protein [Candidatus Bilamarchaeaceae archaeon]
MNNPFLPELASIVDVKQEAATAKTLTIALKSGRKFECAPGQFVEVSVFGFGEFPVSVSRVASSPENCFDITVRRVGKVTGRLVELPVGATIGIRGPFGRGFPLERIEGRDLLLIAGGMGMSPLKYAVDHILARRNHYGTVSLLYGAASPKDVLYKDTLFSWASGPQEYRELHVMLTVDEPDQEWRWNIGLVTELIDRTQVTPETTSALICGPSPMMRAATEILLTLGCSEDQLFLSFERRMQCGMGMCGHCTIGYKRVCLDGPVFTYQEVRGVLERLF